MRGEAVASLACTPGTLLYDRGCLLGYFLSPSTKHVKVSFLIRLISNSASSDELEMSALYRGEPLLLTLITLVIIGTYGTLR